MRTLPRGMALATIAIGAVLAGCGGGDGATGPGQRPDRIAITEVRSPLFVGQSVQLDARALDASGAEIAAGDAEWTSGTPAVAEVTPAGLLTGVSAGTSVLTARINGRGGTVTVTVENLPPALTTVTMAGATFTPADVTIRLNGTVNFVFPATAHDIVFATSPTGAPANIASSTNRTTGRQFLQTGDFTYSSTLQPGKTGVVRVR